MPRNASLGSSDLNTTNYDVATSCHVNQNDLGKPQLVRMKAQGQVDDVWDDVTRYIFYFYLFVGDHLSSLSRTEVSVEQGLSSRGAFRFACGFSVPMVGDTAVPFIQLRRGIWRSLFLVGAHTRPQLRLRLLSSPLGQPRPKSPPSPPWPPTTPNRRAPT
jgi:hypothetical protein